MGALGATVFKTLDLPPVAYIASEAVTAIGMHAVKMAVDGAELRLPMSFWPLALGAAMVAGAWASKRLIQRLPIVWFRRLVTVLLVAISLQMIITG